MTKVLGLVLLLVSQNVLAVGLSGKIIVTTKFLDSLEAAQKDQDNTAKAYYWNEPNGISPVRPPRVNPNEDLGVVLLRKGDSANTPEKLTTVKVRAGGLEPGVLITRPGSTVRFRSVDPFEHELYVSGMESFKPELQSKGQFRHIEFANEGIFEVRCKTMPHFRAYIVVVNAGQFVNVKPDGEFSSENLEPGEYELKVFHGGSWIHTQTVSIPEGSKKDVKVDVSLESGASSEQASAEAKKEG